MTNSQNRPQLNLNLLQCKATVAVDQDSERLEFKAEVIGKLDSATADELVMKYLLPESPWAFEHIILSQKFTA